MSGIPAGAGSLLGKRLGKFEILALLALGGTAEIYLARIGGAAGFEKYVVVKCLHDHLADDQEFVKMFLDEARLAAHLDHSNIVQTMELGEHENRYYMVMEFLAGLSLAMVVRRTGERLGGGRIPVPLVLNMMAQACAGLHYAHERAVNGKALNIVHRDISPQNLVVSFEGVVKVVDFGIAKAEQRETKTRSGTIKGKFAYMSPEQCIAANVDRRTDVFALGVIAHELLTGRRLFKRNSPYETYQAVIDCDVAPPSKLNVELEPALDTLIMKAVAKDKDQRYQTAEAFGDALLGYLHHRGKGSGPGDVSRFFDAHFSQEIEEHSARMRELISGQEFSVDTGVNWSEDEEARREARRNETVDLGGARGERSMDLHTGDLLIERESSSSLDEALEAGDEGDLPADKTRIESNPLERLAEFDKEKEQAQAKEKGTTPIPKVTRPNPKPADAQPQARPATGRAPHQPAPTPSGPANPASNPRAQSPTARAPAVMPPSGPLPLPAPPSGPAPGPGFPNLSNLPTMVAQSPADAKTEVAGLALNLDMPPPPPPGRPRAKTDAAQLGTAPTMQRPSVVPTDYPVMSPEMSQQIARGADLFPSQPYTGGRGAVPQPSQPQPSQRPTQPMPGSAMPGYGSTGPQGPATQLPGLQLPSPPLQGMQGQGMQGPPIQGSPIQGSPMHGSPMQGPPMQGSPMHGSPMQGPPMQGQGPQGHAPRPLGPESGAMAVQLMSPVGSQFGQAVDWEAAAARPLRVLPGWLLGALFIGAIGLALTITIVIARLAR